MRKYKIMGLIITVGVVLSLKSGDFEEIISRLKKSVIPIKFTIKRIYGGMQEVEEEVLQRAIVITNDLIVITDGAAISGGGGFSMIVSASTQYTHQSFGRGRIKPKFARVYLGKDAVIPAKFLGINKDYDIAYFQLQPKSGEKIDLQPLEVVDEEKINLKVGDKVYRLTLDVRGRKFGFPFQVDESVVSYKFEGSQYEFSVGWNFEIVVDKNLNILGFGFESPITRKISKAPQEFSTSGWDESLESSRYGMLFTKSKLQAIVKNIPREKKVGWLGFLPSSLERISEELREELKLSKEMAGLRVTNIPPHTPVETADLKMDDIIIEIGGKKTIFEKPQEADEFFEWLSNELEIGKKYEVKFLRNEHGNYTEKHTSIVTVGKPVFFDDIDEVEFKVFGIRVKPITYDYRFDNRLPENINGLVVILARMGEPFNVGGIYAGDIIMAIGKTAEGLKEIKSVEEFKNILKQLKDEKPNEIMVKVFTGGFVYNQWEGGVKEIKIKTVRLGERNYRELERDLENN